MVRSERWVRSEGDGPATICLLETSDAKIRERDEKPRGGLSAGREAQMGLTYLSQQLKGRKKKAVVNLHRRSFFLASHKTGLQTDLAASPAGGLMWARWTGRGTRSLGMCLAPKTMRQGRSSFLRTIPVCG